MLDTTLIRKKLLCGRRVLVAVLVTLAIGSAAHAAEPTGKYADVNGLHMYYEVHGEGCAHAEKEHLV